MPGGAAACSSAPLAAMPRCSRASRGRRADEKQPVRRMAGDGRTATAGDRIARCSRTRHQIAFRYATHLSRMRVSQLLLFSFLRGLLPRSKKTPVRCHTPGDCASRGWAPACRASACWWKTLWRKNARRARAAARKDRIASSCCLATRFHGAGWWRRPRCRLPAFGVSGAAAGRQTKAACGEEGESEETGNSERKKDRRRRWRRGSSGAEA